MKHIHKYIFATIIILLLTSTLQSAPSISKSDNLHQWIVIIIELLAIVVAFFIIKKFLPQRKNLSFEEEIPDTFLELSPELRKQALSYAWNIGIKALDSFSAKPFILAIIDISINIAIFIFGTITLIILFREGPLVAFIISLLFTSLLIYLALKNKLKIDYTEEIEPIERFQREKLTTIASTFINENVESWIKDAKINHIDNGILEITDSIPDKTYALYSSDVSVLSDSRIPPSLLGITFILVGKYLVVIDKIYIDIKKITYSYINKDTPTIYVSEKEDWNSEEFYYQDVVEIGYNANEGNAVNVEFSGNLFISLINGTIKEYPTSKKYIETLFTDVRRRVREAKLT